MNRQNPVPVFLLALAWTTSAQDSERVKVELSLSKKHVPTNIKPGDRMDHCRVDGKTVTPGGKVSYVTNVIAKTLELIAKSTNEASKDPQHPLKVEVHVPRLRAALIQKTKSTRVTVTEFGPGG